ncbi:DUF6875 domain-containing protein [Burkholderia alba]|uniref:DUF6875 domain-containing protein n=1 Tax=Burkholderia alba TaxID=2683677 RepID=UPI002B05637F|nr:hypothetical protein [Burkholderia alba]
MAWQSPDLHIMSFEAADACPKLHLATQWIRTFLCAPHPDIGRDGDVCPFTRVAISKDSFEFVRNMSQTPEAFMDEAAMHLEDFERCGGKTDIYRCRLIVPVELDRAADVIETTQSSLKPHFISRHLMIGQFYPECQEGGLWKPDFRPLQCPIPLIAIRNMVPTDVAFLYGDVAYMASYRRRFGERAERAIRQYEEAKKGLE